MFEELTAEFLLGREKSNVNFDKGLENLFRWKKNPRGGAYEGNSIMKKKALCKYFTQEINKKLEKGRMKGRGSQAIWWADKLGGRHRI